MKIVEAILLGYGLAWFSRFLPLILAATGKRMGVSPQQLERYSDATGGGDE